MVTNLNGYFLEVARDCDEICKPMCTQSGFGLAVNECTRCCNSSLCNNYDGGDYYRPNAVFRPRLGPFLLLAFCAASLKTG